MFFKYSLHMKFGISFACSRIFLCFLSIYGNHDVVNCFMVFIVVYSI